MSRGWLWLQLTVAWLPMWALFTAVIVIVHGLPLPAAAVASLRLIGPGALLGIGVYRLASHWPWPHPFRPGFVVLHALAGLGYAAGWFVLVALVNSIAEGALVFAGPGIGLFIITGIWLYIMVAGVAYANLAAQRTAMMQAHAARMQLDALRSQLHPHFLFNALHTVVQLIPVDPRAAAGAAEQLAAALRTTIEERRDLISLAEEWTFVERYLAIEGIRFGERLRVRVEIGDDAREMRLPSFALQTLVENAVIHGAAPRIETTTIAITARKEGDNLVVKVEDDGVGQVGHGAGTGLQRLRERMRWLYGDRARLDLAGAPGNGFTAVLVVPQRVEGSVAQAIDGDDDDA